VAVITETSMVAEVLPAQTPVLAPGRGQPEVGFKAEATVVCPRCGGSGTLRLGDQRYRTCLDCLGEGRLLPPDLPRGLHQVINAVTSSASR